MSIESRSYQYGSIFGPWQLGERLGSGSGGMSAVFMLHHRGADFDECSVLKVISLIEETGKYKDYSQYQKEECANTLRIRKDQAKQEVKLMELLRGYTNIVDYLDYDFSEWADNSGFGCDLLIRMELLNGLRSEMKQGRLFSETEVIRIGKDICNALILCHSKNILHQDIKPENIFVNRDGNYKLGDFGIARILDPSVDANTSIGTLQYAAPEQLRGTYDKRVDIYSLGLVLYELSNQNRLPFADSSYVSEEAVNQRLKGKQLPRPACASEALANVIMKACASAVKDRFRSAQDLWDALDAVERMEKKERNRFLPGLKRAAIRQYLSRKLM